MAWNAGMAAGTPAYAIAASAKTRVRVVAGPGTGKSFSMKRRVARLLESSVDPKSILPVTFTRVAAEDLHRELVGMGVSGCDKLEGVTLHGLALRILMRNHVLAATGRVPRPLNEFELDPLICDLMPRHGGKKAVQKLRMAYEAAWARLQHQQPGFVQSPAEASFQADLKAWLEFHQSMLIGEVIPQCYQYLYSNPNAQEKREFAHILVDEYQDLNKAEQGLIELLSQSAHVCIVGDDDQSIYSFKHAHPDGIREWLVNNSGADDIGLNECRRCPTRVVEMANSLISKNQISPVPRALVPLQSNGPGDVQIIQYTTISHEVRGITALVLSKIAAGVPPGDVLILTQSRAFGLPLYDSLVASGIPTKSYYSESELSSIEAQESLALLKLFVSREDRVALRWLVGLNASKWNAAGYKRVREYCETSGLSPWDTLCKLADGTLAIPGTSRILLSFRGILQSLAALEGLSSLKDVVDQLFPHSKAEVRAVRELAVATLARIDPDDRASLVREIATAISQPEIPVDIQDVRIMSLHKSKGLSSPVTIIAGCVQGLLPRPADSTLTIVERMNHLEEQRRLFYVGITRVKAVPSEQKPGTLIMTYSQRMPSSEALQAGITPAQRVYGDAILHASQFIQELGPSAPAPVAG